MEPIVARQLSDRDLRRELPDAQADRDAADAKVRAANMGGGEHAPPSSA